MKNISVLQQITKTESLAGSVNNLNRTKKWSAYQ